jgi:sigma-B regulation protein RsbU (phosphoserine phosphatase)
VLAGHIGEGRFVSLFYGRLDAQTQMVTYANAGHPPPLLVRRDGTVARLEEGGPVLGVFCDAEYAQGEVDLSGGDRLVLYTDGLTEACDAHDDEYGERRLIELIVANRACSAPALQARLMASAGTFAGGMFQDDATLLVVAAEWRETR